MGSYIDCHCHILPGIDDGAKDIAQTEQMLRQALQAGYQAIVATPHYHPRRGMASKEKVIDAVEVTRELIQKKGWDIQIFSGNEIYYDHNTIKNIENNVVCTLADSKYVLIEFSPGAEYSEILDAVRSVQSIEYFPVIAHAERIECLWESKRLVDELFDMDAYFQINGSSITGVYGRLAKKTCEYLLKEGMVSFVGTDAHDIEVRTMDISKAIKHLYKKYEDEYVNEILYLNIEKVIQGKEI